MTAPVLNEEFAPIDLSENIVSRKISFNDLVESIFRSLIYVIHRLKQFEHPEIIESFDSSSNEEALSCMKHEIKQHKETQPNLISNTSMH